MKAIIIVFFISIINIHYSIAQTIPTAYRVYFKDKGSNNESIQLSQRALLRRNAQHILLDEKDNAIYKPYLDQTNTILQSNVLSFSRWLNTAVFLVTDTTLIKIAEQLPFIKKISCLGPYYSNFTQRNSHCKTTTGGAAFYNNTWDQTNLVHGNLLHDLGYKGKGKWIAVIDAGFENVDTHPVFDSLRINGRIIDSYNFVLNNHQIYTEGIHGTAVLSTLAGNVPNTFMGSAPDASYALYITENNHIESPVEMDFMAAAMEHADSIGIDIITTSLGYNNFDAGFTSLKKSDLDGHSTVAAMAANIAVSKGIFVVASAGNEGGNSWDYLLTPGDADSVLTVGSVDINKNVAGDSGPGPNYSNTVKPDVCAMGVNAAVVTTDYSHLSGTSFATPEVAGFVACLWQGTIYNPSLFKLKKAVQNCADHSKNPTPKLGYGIANFDCSLSTLNVIIDFPHRPFYGIYPNPFVDNFNIDLNNFSADETTLIITEITGKTILKQEFSANQKTVNINLSTYPAGIYFLKVETKENKFNFKIEKL